MNYKTFSPSAQLAPFVKCFWLLEAPADPHAKKQIITPDGCMELIIHYGDPYLQFDEDQNPILQPRSFVFGQITSPLVIAPTGTSGMVAARFHPDGFIAFSTIPISEMQNRAVSLRELYGDEGIQLEKSVLASSTEEERVTHVEKFLVSRLSNSKNVGVVVKETFDLLMASRGQMSIDSLAQKLEVNRRQLERKLSAATGLSPKQLAKIVRLQSTLKLMERKQFASLTELAHEGGYFDQAHFIKDFKEFTGVSPRQFYASNMIMSALFIGQG